MLEGQEEKYLAQCRPCCTQLVQEKECSFFVQDRVDNVQNDNPQISDFVLPKVVAFRSV